MLFVGDGFDIEQLKKLATKLGLDDRVIRVGRVSDIELLRGYYLCSDLFLLRFATKAHRANLPCEFN